MITPAIRQCLVMVIVVGVLAACGGGREPAATSAPEPTATMPAEVAAPTDEPTPTEAPAPTEEITPTVESTPGEVTTPTGEIAPTTAITIAEEITPTAGITSGEGMTPTDAKPVESVDAAQCDALQAAVSEKLGHELTKQEGTACTLVATGTGEEFGNLVDVAQSIREVFEAEGWAEDKTAVADGPTGTSSNYAKGTTVATVSVGWGPAADANCPTDQPIAACDLQPSQQDFTITIELVQIA